METFAVWEEEEVVRVANITDIINKTLEQVQREVEVTVSIEFIKQKTMELIGANFIYDVEDELELKKIFETFPSRIVIGGIPLGWKTIQFLN